MRKIFIVIAFPLVFGFAAFVTLNQPNPWETNSFSAPAQARAEGEVPDPIPEINGMVFIPAGEFIMGSNLDDLKKSAESDEFPQRSVFVGAFYIDIHEVTNAEYKYYVDSMEVAPPHRWWDGKYPVGQDGFPVVDISWDEAAAYARFAGKRLPTEEEWEKAARGTDGRTYPWGDEFFNEYANNSDRLMPIMRFPLGKSPYGLYDMAGNAAEWVDAWYAAYPRGADDKLPDELARRKQRYPEKKYRVYRGGSWNSYGKYLRCANREREKPDKKWLDIGFRCAMDPPWEND